MPTGVPPEPTIWVDVEDFLSYFEFNPRPSGIQRVAFEIERALIEAAGADRIRFVRRAPGRDELLQEVAWRDAESIFFSRPMPEEARPPGRPRDDERRMRVRRAIQRLPPELREPLFRAGTLQSQVGYAVRDLVKALRPPAPRQIRAGREAIPEAGAGGFASRVRPGDVLLSPGAPWSVAGFAELAAELKGRYGMRLALLVHDLAPLRRPEWFDPAAVTRFRNWLEATLPLCATVLAVSAHTAADLEAYARETGIALSSPVLPVPLGATFPAGEAAAAPGLPRPGRYVLFVSTLEARKNHALVVNVWRKLMDEVRQGRRDAGSVPELVFAGRVGAMVADLVQQLDNMAYLRGRIRLIRDPTDAELLALYQGCLFTIFPSLFEGWGLPVTESLALGKPCLASNATAIPEAGGALSRYFDPENVGSAHRAVSALLDDPAAIASWQDQVRREFQPRPWSDTARAILAGVAAP